ncbi:MAG: hypothetical protein EPN46_08085 [Candidimonas sp.]|nr:MAG: hypothetical protein EPN62_03765 [Candidimonas sp.]TAM76725.1 MAG: hypothetical protein EPN46_08085 [Candidimonas sp.]
MRKLLIVVALGSVVLAGCAPLLTGQVAEAGYNAAKSALGSPDDSKKTAIGQDARQQKLQSVLNSVEVGQSVAPILEKMGEPPKEKTGNERGFNCYEFPAVYSATAAAVIVGKEGKVVFFGNSRCADEMQNANFVGEGKYAGNTTQ